MLGLMHTGQTLPATELWLSGFQYAWLLALLSLCTELGGNFFRGSIEGKERAVLVKEILLT